jgi:hypothetical protein
VGDLVVGNCVGRAVSVMQRHITGKELAQVPVPNPNHDEVMLEEYPTLPFEPLLVEVNPVQPLADRAPVVVVAVQ